MVVSDVRDCQLCDTASDRNVAAPSPVRAPRSSGWPIRMNHSS